MSFQTADYVIFGCTLGISAAIGIYFRFSGGQQKTNEEYLVGDRKQNPLLVAISLMSTFMSAVSMLGGASEAYNYGTSFFVLNLGFLIGICLGLITFVPVFYNLKCFSVYTYLELRFGSTIRFFVSIAFVLQMLLYGSIALAAPAMALQTVTNMSNPQAILIVGLVCTFYATIGGMKTIIFTDLFQSVLMFGALFSIIYTGLNNFGGFSNILDIAQKNGRIDFTNFSMDVTVRHTWFSTIFGGVMNALFLKGINQVQIQRYMSMKNYRNIVLSALISWPLITLLSFTSCFCGLIVFAKYEHCDPLQLKRISANDQLLPLYVLDTFKGTGLTGIFVSGIFSASLSTISPLLNSLAAVTLEDYVKPLLKYYTGKKIEMRSSFITQIFAAVFGISCVLISLLALRMNSILQASVIVFSVVGGPVVGVFSLGMFTSGANEMGSLIGFIVGIVSCSWLAVGKPKPEIVRLPTYTDNCNFTLPAISTISGNVTETKIEYPFAYRISYMFYSFIGFFLTFAIGYVFSLLIPDKSEKKKIDSRLFIKPVASRIAKTNTFSSDNNITLNSTIALDRNEELIYHWQSSDEKSMN
ncbi:hypothetical protein PGB90_003079 [Kerria lacca]